MSSSLPNSCPDAVNPSSSIISPLQQMMSQRIISSQNKEWRGDPLIQPRDYPKVYVDSAGETYEQYVWVIELKGDSSGNMKCKCNFCTAERVGPRLSIAAHITGQRFGSLQVVHLLQLMSRQKLFKKKLTKNRKQQKVNRHRMQVFSNFLLPPQHHKESIPR